MESFIGWQLLDEVRSPFLIRATSKEEAEVKGAQECAEKETMFLEASALPPSGGSSRTIDNSFRKRLELRRSQNTTHTGYGRKA